MIKEKLIKVKTADGEQVALWNIYSDKLRLTKHIFLTHGTFSNRKIFIRISTFFVEQGFTCWLMEWRSHGESSVAEQAFNFESISDFDIPAVFEYLFEKEKIEHLTCLTHSGGGLCLTMFLVNNKKYIPKIKSITFLACQASGAVYNFKNYCAIFLGKYLSALFGKVPASSVGAKEHDESYYTMKQWFDWNLKRNFWSKNDFDYAEKMNAIRIPILSIAGKGDTLIAPPIACKAFLESFQNEKNEWRCYAIENGNKENYNHSRILNSKNAQVEVWPDIVNWIEEHI